MKRHSIVLCALVAALAVGLLFAGPASANGWRHHSQHLVFVQTNDPAGNQIAVYDRNRDGTLRFSARYDTGGLGGVAAGAVADPLASQGSLVVAKHGHLLLAVNGGSDTVSLFRIAGDRLFLRQVISSGGDFPASIAARGSLVYVLNSGGVGTLQGYRIWADRLHPLYGSSRSLGLANTVPPDFLASPGQVGFTPDGSRLIVTTKASGSTIDVFGVRFSGRLSAEPVLNPSTTPVPFAFTFDRSGRLVVTEAAMSHVSTYSLNGDNTLTGLGSVADGQTALCWITAARGFFYGSNAGSANVSSFTVAGDGTPALAEAVAASTDAGTTDSATTRDQRFLYVQCGGAGTVDAFRIAADGTLTRIDTVGGLPVGMEGIVTLN